MPSVLFGNEFLNYPLYERSIWKQNKGHDLDQCHLHARFPSGIVQPDITDPGIPDSKQPYGKKKKSLVFQRSFALGWKTGLEPATS